MHGLWTSNIPSRFLDELPEADVEVTESKGGFGSGYGRRLALRRDDPFRLELRHPRLAARAAQQGPPRRRLRAATASRTPTPTPPTIWATTAPQRPIPLREGGSAEGVNSGRGKPRSRLPLTIEGELVAKSTGTVSDFAIGDRVFHQKFGNGNVTAIDGNKLTIQFDKAGEKRVVDSFVERV